MGVIAGLLGWIATLLGPSLPGQAAPAGRAPPAESARVLKMARDLARDADPEVRGEAVLLLAASDAPVDADVFGLALATSKDPAPDARVRGIVALGILAEVGVEVRLTEILDGDPSLDAAAAALALGMLPDKHPGIAVEAYFTKFQGSSYRRQRATLEAMLVGLGLGAHPTKVRALQDLYDDDALKDPTTRRLLMFALHSVPHGLTDEEVAQLVDERDASLRALGARWLVTDGEAPSDEALLRLEELAARDSDPGVRAAALDSLTRARHLPALELAAKAATSRHPVEAAQGVRSAAALGGGAMVQALEDRVLATRRPELQIATMAALPAGSTPRFLEACAALASNTRKPAALRCTAALILARSGDADVAPLLRTLFATEAGEQHRGPLARALVALTPDPPGLDHLHPAGEPLDAARLEALLAAGHPAAPAALAEALERSDAPRAALLRAWRRGLSLHPTPPASDALPEAINAFL